MAVRQYQSAVAEFRPWKTRMPRQVFASIEIKIVLAHLLLRYDWKFIGNASKSKEGHRFVPDPDVLLS